MAAITVTEANVGIYGDPANSTIDTATRSGEALDMGEAVYLKAADGRWWRARAAAAGSDEEAGLNVDKGIVISPAQAAGDGVVVVTLGYVYIGDGTVTEGGIWLGKNYGELVEDGDLSSYTSGDRYTQYGSITLVSNSIYVLRVNPDATGNAVP